MKWLYTFIGSLFGFIIEMILPIPQFFLDLGNTILTTEGIANYPGLPTVVKAITLIMAFLLLPSLGGASGYTLGSKRH